MSFSRLWSGFGRRRVDSESTVVCESYISKQNILQIAMPKTSWGYGNFAGGFQVWMVKALAGVPACLTSSLQAHFIIRWDKLMWFTYPRGLVMSLCRSFLHSSQKYSSGLAASSIMPTHPPCCQTLQISHWINKPPASSACMSDSANEEDNWPSLDLPASEGGPGYSCCPQTHLVISSSSPISSSSSSSSFVESSSSLSFSRVLRRVCGGSLCGLRAKSSTSSEERECGVDDFWGEGCLLLDLVARSVRPDDTEDEELLWAGTLGGGCVVRARDERRGDIVKNEQ